MSKIIGNTTATPNPRPDWNQTDETKADYIKNKPDLSGFATQDYVDNAIETYELPIATASVLGGVKSAGSSDISSTEYRIYMYSESYPEMDNMILDCGKTYILTSQDEKLIDNTITVSLYNDHNYLQDLDILVNTPFTVPQFEGVSQVYTIEGDPSIGLDRYYEEDVTLTVTLKEAIDCTPNVYVNADGTMHVDIPEQVQADWKQDDETAPDYIKNKLGLEFGEAAKTTQQPGSLAISEGATAFGVENFAGLRSFEIVGWDINNNTYTISSPLSEEVPVGAEFGIQVRLIYYRHGTIINISEDRLTLTVDNYVDIDAEIASKGPDIAKYIWFTDYPTIGDTDEGLYAFTSGAVNQATHFAATALGYGNKAVGKYAVALGRQTEAHYAAFAAGYDTHAINEEAIAIGYSSTASARVSTAIGQGLKATEKNQIVLGRFNEEDPNALLIVGNGTKDSIRSNAFTVGFDGQLKTPFEPTSDENLVNKKYVDNVESSIDDKLIEFESSVNTTLNEVEDHLDTFQDRLANIEAGYVTLSTETSEIQLPKMPANDIIISKIGGKSIEGINKLNPKYVIKGGSAKGQGASFELNNNDIIVTYDTTGGGIFAFGVELDVIPDTIYRIAFARTGTGNSVGTIYFYSDKLWGTSANVYSPSANTTKNTVSFKGDYLTFNSGNNTHLVIGFYSAKNRTVLTETFSNVMITEGEDEVSYVPYYIAPAKTTIIKSYNKNGVQIGTYDVPTTIQNLPGYGHTDSSVDFMALTYSYKTTDGENFTTLPTVISIADLITEAPRLQAESEGTVQFVNNQSADVYAAILYQKEVASTVEVIDNLDSTDSSAALSANMGRELSEKIVGYSNTYSSFEYSEDHVVYDTDLRLSTVDPNGSSLVLQSQYIEMGDAYITSLFAGKTRFEMVTDGEGREYIDLTAKNVTKNGKEIAIKDDIITYNLSKSGSTITLTGSDGSTSSVIDVGGGDGDGDGNTQYKLAKSGNYIQLLDASDDSVVSQVIDNTGEANQNAFSNIKINSTTISADSKTDTLTLVAGDNITLTPDATNDQITISATDTNTEYKLDKNNGNIRLLNAKTNEVVSQVADSVGNTEEPITYTLSKSGTTISLTGSDGSVTSVTDSVGQTGDGEPNQNAFSNITIQNSVGGTKFTEAADMETDTLYIKEGNNITITDGGDDTLIISATIPEIPSVTVTNNNPTLTWGTQSTVGTVDGTALTVVMPAKPDIEDNNTEYRLEKSNGYIQLINAKDSSVVSEVIDSVGGGPDGNTQYKLVKSGNYIQLLDASDDSVVSQVIDEIGDGEANVQSDWNETDSTSDAYIKNKPTSMPPSAHTHQNITSSEKFELEVQLTSSERTKQVGLTNDPSFDGTVSNVSIDTYAVSTVIDYPGYESDSDNQYFDTHQFVILLSYDKLGIHPDSIQRHLEYIEFYYANGENAHDQVPYNSADRKWEFSDDSVILNDQIRFTDEGLEITVHGFDVPQGTPDKFYIWVQCSQQYIEETKVTNAVTWSQSGNNLTISVRSGFNMTDTDYLKSIVTYNLNIGSDLNSNNVYAYFNSLAFSNIMPVSGDSIRPSIDNKYNFGTASKRWKQIYAANSTISTSDKNEKTDIEALDDKYMTLFDNLKPVKYKFKENDSDRIHTGLIAQDIEEALTTAGLTSKDFAGLCYWNKEDGTKGYGLRYEEFIALNIAETQKLKKENEELKARLAAIEDKFNSL